MSQVFGMLVSRGRIACLRTSIDCRTPTVSWLLLEWRELCRVAEDDHPWKDRLLDLEYFTSAATRALLEELDIKLIVEAPRRELWHRRLGRS